MIPTLTVTPACVVMHSTTGTVNCFTGPFDASSVI